MKHSYKESFKKFTREVPSDGDCFIWSLRYFLDQDSKKLSNDEIRSALYNVAVQQLGIDFVKNDSDYDNLRKPKVWVEWVAGSVAASLYIKKPVIVATEFGGIIAENGKVTILNDAERNSAIKNGAITIAYNQRHYQPLPSDKVENFINGLNDLQEINDFTEEKESPEEILFDAIGNVFTGNNQREAQNTVKEILANINSPQEREDMIKILFEGIIAEHRREQKNRNSVFDKINAAKKRTYDEIPKSSQNHAKEIQ